MRMKARPGVVSHILCCLLCLMLTGLIVLTPIVTALTVTVTQPQLHRKTAASESILVTQLELIDEKLTELADLYHFDKAPIAALVTEEAVRQLNRDTLAWWTSLFSADPVLDAPCFNADAAYDIVLADEGFLEYSGSHSRTFARRVVKGVRNAVNQTVLPIRSQLITLALKQINARLDITVVTALIPWLPLLIIGVMLVISTLMLLLCGRLICKGILYIGCGLSAGGLLTVIMTGGLMLLDLPGLFGTYSTMMQLQLAPLMKWIYPAFILYGMVCVAVGILLVNHHQKVMPAIRLANREEVPA